MAWRSFFWRGSEVFFSFFISYILLGDQAAVSSVIYILTFFFVFSGTGKFRAITSVHVQYNDLCIVI